ncbi:MAG: hypothetical protein EB120_14650, partial [Proteobacteria bacterium]|nr:hypothetical protein [Pseudomonadota bacterium]
VFFLSSQVLVAEPSLEVRDGKYTTQDDGIWPAEIRTCLPAKHGCKVDWECCSNSCYLDGLCQDGANGCVHRGGHCSVGWECCSGNCDESSHLCH